MGCIYGNDGMYGFWCDIYKQHINKRDCNYCRNYTEPEPPTEKQIRYAEFLANTLDLDLPEFSKRAYSEFISTWKEHV